MKLKYFSLQQMIFMAFALTFSLYAGNVFAEEGKMVFMIPKMRLSLHYNLPQMQ